MKNSVRKLQIPLVFFAQFLILFQNNRLEPEKHHDGLIFAGAVAVSEGLVPNRDFFSQYGPITSQVQGLFLHFMSAELLDVRMLMSILISVNGAIVYYFVSRLWGVTIAVLATLLWLLQLSARLPWPSILSSTMVLLVFLLLIQPKKDEPVLSHGRIRIATAGILLGITPFVRVHNIVFILLLLLALTVWGPSRKYFLSLFSWATLSFSMYVLMMFFNGSLFDYVYESVTWPLARYGSPEISKSYVVGALWYPVVTLAVFAYLFWIRVYFKLESPVRKIVVLFVSLLVWVAISFSFILKRDGYLSLRNPKILYLDFSYNIVHFMGYFAAGALVFAIVRTFLRRGTETLVLLNLGLGLGTLTQLYPLYDEVHLWFIAPVLMVCSAIGLSNFKLPDAIIKKSAVFFVPPLIILSALVIQDWNQPRVSFNSPILNGMMGSPSSVRNLDGTLNMLNTRLLDNNIIFDCAHGLYAVHNGTFSSAIRSYVNWAPGFESPVSGVAYFVCDIPESLYQEYRMRSQLIAEISYVSNQTVYYSAILRAN